MSSVQTHLMYQLRLDVAAFQPELFEANRRRLVDQGIHITTLAAELARDAVALDAIYEFHNECRRRQPPIEIRQRPIPRHLWVEACVDGDEALPDAYFIAVDGERYVGVSVVHRILGEPEVLTAGFTGVLAAESGRGIGLAVKSETIAYACSHGYQEIRTGVLAENVAMLRINEELGFRVDHQEVRRYVY